MLCGQRPTVLDDKLDDYGAAYPGFLILNPKLLAEVSTPVKLWIHAHECGHQFRGPDEETADCFAVQRGRRQGWLTPEGLEEVCNFIAPAKGDSMHFSGSHRCEVMRSATPIPPSAETFVIGKQHLDGGQLTGVKGVWNFEREGVCTRRLPSASRMH